MKATEFLSGKVQEFVSVLKVHRAITTDILVRILLTMQLSNNLNAIFVGATV